ncbi:MAG: mechanosensitive ion channel family protein, partial [Longimicrobiales bacterium]
MKLQATLDYQLLVLSGKAVTVGSVLTATVVLLATLIGSRVIRGILTRTLTKSGVNAGALGTVDRVVYYSFLTVGVAVALSIIGIDLSALFATGAVAAVALAFAMQNILQNFVSGIILLAERSIKPSDVLVVEGQKVRVDRMGIRATIARTTDDEEIILPNSTLVQGTVKNLTLADGLARVRTCVGVAYDSDLDLVLEVLHSAAT